MRATDRQAARMFYLDGLFHAIKYIFGTLWASTGTGNMKFAFNGALTIGTPDGANPEIREEVDGENFFLLGLTVEQVREMKLSGYRRPQDVEKNTSLREILDFIASGASTGGGSNLCCLLLDRLLYEDPLLVSADYQAYADCQEQVSGCWRDLRAWMLKAILNTACIGEFSSDRSVREHCEQVRQVKLVKAPLWSAVTQMGDARRN